MRIKKRNWLNPKLTTITRQNNWNEHVLSNCKAWAMAGAPSGTYDMCYNAFLEGGACHAQCNDVSGILS